MKESSLSLRERVLRNKMVCFKPLNLTSPWDLALCGQMVLPLRSLRGRGPRCAKRKALLGKLYRGGLGKPLGRGEVRVRFMERENGNQLWNESDAAGLLGVAVGHRPAVRGLIEQMFNGNAGEVC
jgi:hypothetical protein